MVICSILEERKENTATLPEWLSEELQLLASECTQNNQTDRPANCHLIVTRLDELSHRVANSGKTQDESHDTFVDSAQPNRPDSQPVDTKLQNRPPWSLVLGAVIAIAALLAVFFWPENGTVSAGFDFTIGKDGSLNDTSQQVSLK